jgi:four helix bundle protein
MVAKRYEDLEVWQVSNELKRRIYALIASSAAKQDGKFCDQIRSSAASAPANIAEGFGYYDHPEFGRHLRIAKASLDETHNHLKDGVDRNYWRQDDAAPLLELANNAAGKCVRLEEYLARTEAPRSWRKPRRRSRIQ